MFVERFTTWKCSTHVIVHDVQTMSYKKCKSIIYAIILLSRTISLFICKTYSILYVNKYKGIHCISGTNKYEYMNTHIIFSRIWKKRGCYSYQSLLLYIYMHICIVFIYIILYYITIETKFYIVNPFITIQQNTMSM